MFYHLLYARKMAHQAEPSSQAQALEARPTRQSVTTTTKSKDLQSFLLQDSFESCFSLDQGEPCLVKKIPL